MTWSIVTFDPDRRAFAVAVATKAFEMCIRDRSDTTTRHPGAIVPGLPVPVDGVPAKPVLLVVDDEEGPRQSVRIIFKDEYHVLLANNGEQAVELARKHSVCVVVSDILMTGMSGIDLLKDLKDIDPAIEVIMLTAYETIETARQMCIRDRY